MEMVCDPQILALLRIVTEAVTLGVHETCTTLPILRSRLRQTPMVQLETVDFPPLLHVASRRQLRKLFTLHGS